MMCNIFGCFWLFIAVAIELKCNTKIDPYLTAFWGSIIIANIWFSRGVQ